MFEGVCAARSVIIVKGVDSPRSLSSTATGRHLCEHIWLLFVGTQLHNVARNKSVHGLWEYKISCFGAAQEQAPVYFLSKALGYRL